MPVPPALLLSAKRIHDNLAKYSADAANLALAYDEASFKNELADSGADADDVESIGILDAGQRTLLLKIMLAVAASRPAVKK